MVSVKLKAVGIFVVGLTILSLFVWSLPRFISPILTDIEQAQSEIFDLINEERVSRGLPPLLKDDALASVALEWSEHLAEIDDLNHGDFAGRIAGIGYSQYQCGEIIAMYEGWTTSLGRQFVDMWLDSPGHYQTMMISKSGYMGVGVSKGRGFFAVVDFRFTES